MAVLEVERDTLSRRIASATLHHHLFKLDVCINETALQSFEPSIVSAVSRLTHVKWKAALVPLNLSLIYCPTGEAQTPVRRK